MDAKEIKNVAVIGAGLMGHGIAMVFAAQGCGVSLMDTQPDILAKAKGQVRDHLELFARKGMGRPEEIGPILERIKTTPDLQGAAAGAQFVVEAVSENLALKQKIFQELDALCSAEVILATNTSVISISEIARDARFQDRIVGAHFWNPPYLIPLVEVVRGEKTSPRVMDASMEFLKRMGKHPVRVNKDVPGFVGNRLQHALWREALHIVENGIADAATIDEVITQGLGIRLPVLGPMENMDMVSLDLTKAVHDYLLKHLSRAVESSPLLAEKLAKNEGGFKSGQGFYPWPPQRIQESRKKLEEHLLEWMKRESGHSRE